VYVVDALKRWEPQVTVTSKQLLSAAISKPFCVTA
jgi:phage baseplate assembly protein W